MSRDYSFAAIDDRQWDILVAASPQASPFNRREFLDALGTTTKYVGIMDGESVVAAAATQLDGHGHPLGPQETFGYCQGILLAPEFEGLPEHSRCRRETEVLHAMAEGLTSSYDDLWLGLHWRLRDVRALQWFNYHEPERGQFELTLRYTGILDLSAWPTPEAYLASLGGGRRDDLRKARKAGIAVLDSVDVDVLDRLHRLTFARQNANRGSFERQLHPMARAALNHGFGELLVGFTPDGVPASAALFVWNTATSHYLFGASDPAHRDTGAATLVLTEAIARAMRRGNRCIDVVGINSPQRGNFKTSFNAVPVPYFEARWHRPT